VARLYDEMEETVAAVVRERGWRGWIITGFGILFSWKEGKGRRKKDKARGGSEGGSISPARKGKRKAMSSITEFTFNRGKKTFAT